MLLVLTACGPSMGTDEPDDTDVDAVLTLTLPDHVPAEDPTDCPLALPEAFECDGSNPAVAWSGAPVGTAGFVLIFDDPDAGDFPHWAVWDLPATSTGIPAGSSGQGLDGGLAGGAKELVNGFGWVGYLGSCPPSEHQYRWSLWAVDDAFDFDAGSGGADRFDDLRDAARKASVARATACHLYGPAVDP